MAFYHMQMQQENIDIGQYQVTVSDRLNNRPIENARVRISYTVTVYNRVGAAIEAKMNDNNK